MGEHLNYDKQQRHSLLDPGNTYQNKSSNYPIFNNVYWVSLCFNWAPLHEGILGEWRYSSTDS